MNEVIPVGFRNIVKSVDFVNFQLLSNFANISEENLFMHLCTCVNLLRSNAYFQIFGSSLQNDFTKCMDFTKVTIDGVNCLNILALFLCTHRIFHVPRSLLNTTYR